MKFRYYALTLVGINILIFILQNFFPFINNNFILYSSRVLSEPWMLITAVFLHANIVHLVYNSMALGIFGSVLESIIGSKKFLVIYLVTGVLASLVSVPFYNAALGASGAIFGIIGTLVVLRPKMIIWLNFMPAPMWLAAIIWAVIDVSGIFLPGNTANIAHLGGLFFGLLIGFFLLKRFRERKGSKLSDALTGKDIDSWENYYMR